MIQKPDIDFVFSNHKFIDDNGQPLQQKVESREEIHNKWERKGLWRYLDYSRESMQHIGIVGFMYTRRCMDRIGGYNPDLYTVEDW